MKTTIGSPICWRRIVPTVLVSKCQSAQICSPRDFDPTTNTIRERPFHKVFGNGLSVWRECGPDEDLLNLVADSLARDEGEKAKVIYAVCEANVDDVRGITQEDGRVFCVYDQTVSRNDPSLDPVPTHAGVFQRLPKPGTQNRNALLRDLAGKLRVLFEQNVLKVDVYRSGICLDMNARSQNGEFVRSGT
jgi:hypothetical protein